MHKNRLQGGRDQGVSSNELYGLDQCVKVVVGIYRMSCRCTTSCTGIALQRRFGNRDSSQDELFGQSAAVRPMRHGCLM